jgi:hypothetical protein
MLKAVTATADSVARFVDLGDMLAHAVLQNSGRQLLVRIKLSRRMEHERYSRMRTLEHSSIEVDLHSLTLEQINDPAAFEHAVLDDPATRSWVRSIPAERLLDRAQRELWCEAEKLSTRWAAEEVERRTAEISRQRKQQEENTERANALATHRAMQYEIMSQRSTVTLQHASPGAERQHRENLIVASMVKAAREWAGRGVECSACHLVNPPSTRFCLYCSVDESEMLTVTIPVDVSTTIQNRMRSSVKPDRSIRAAPTLAVIPDA